MFRFKANIYKVGINWCVNVPTRISDELEKEKGYIRITGLVNQFKFKINLVPVKNAPLPFIRKWPYDERRKHSPQ